MTIFIEAQELSDDGHFEVTRGNEMFKTGYEAAVEVVKKAVRNSA